MKPKETKLKNEFEYIRDHRINELGVTESRFWVKGVCPICNEETTALVIIPKISDDYDKIPNLRVICGKCNREFSITINHDN